MRGTHIGQSPPHVGVAAPLLLVRGVERRLAAHVANVAVDVRALVAVPSCRKDKHTVSGDFLGTS